MLRFVGKRVADSVVTLVLASVLAFLVMRVLPGDPARLIVGPLASEEVLDQTRAGLGLDQPLWSQFLTYLRGVLTGDFGFSYSLGLPVGEALGQRLPATLELALFAFLIAIVLAVVASTLATYGGTRLRGVSKAVSLIGLGTPPFWLGLILLVLFSQRLHWLPGPVGRLDPATAPPSDITGLYTVDALVTGNWAALGGALTHLLLPALTLALLPWAFLTRLLTATIDDTADAPYVLVSRSRGLSAWWTHARHVLPNSLLPAAGSTGLVLAQLITGSVLVETTFNWPGIGQLLTGGIASQDYSLIQTFILFSAFTYVLANLVADLVIGAIDPRIRAGQGVAS